jgi:hypothetical protein
LSAQRATPLLLLAAAAVCVLVALRLLPPLTAPADLDRRAAVIVNDTASPVVVSHCPKSCAGVSGGVSIPPGQELRAGPPSSAPAWLVEDPQGRPLGCLTVRTAAERLPVSRAGPCPA